ncbi:MAG: paraquat-inducible protein A [Saprospiraceae bacterium]|nr:paraquat-inducible protein A [Candidatus Opimibacter iunctus]
MRSPRPLILLFFLLVMLFCSYQLFLLDQHRRAVKEDLIELSKIKYGLFSVDEWKQILSTIISKKIEELNFTPSQKVEMKAKVSAFLTKTIAEMEDRFYEEESQSVSGWLKIGVAGLTGMFDRMKKEVPIYTEQILDFLNDPGNRNKVKGYIMDKLSEYTDKTFAKIDYTEHNRILAQYGYGDRSQTIIGLQAELDNHQQQSRNYLLALFAFIAASGLMLLLTLRVQRLELLIYTLICFLLLGIGLLLPMIEIDARIDEMSFTLLDQPVSFTDQVLYYKSKSILEVVRLMLAQGKTDVMMVGFLVLLFSVLFPVAKLISSMIYIYNAKLRDTRFVRFMVFKTGKWSMADVMVVAIFMSYIGFSGILTEQLNQLEGLTQKLDILTTNKSSLQTGFFLFTSFAILSLLLSQKIQGMVPVKQE